ncbi:MAG: hypothetical protein JAY63_13080 [Candidatus Thiodiazotropha taylori]|nr:hypothetical protein [Candidatus Thiodiazotropha taylori]
MGEYESDTILGVLCGISDEPVINKFKSEFSNEIREFSNLMSVAFKEWKRVDKILTRSKKESDAYISALIYAALNSHVISLKLLMIGLLVPSGNTQRYVLESISTALLMSRPSLGYSERYMHGKYKPKSSVDILVKHRGKLNLDRNGLKVLGESMKFYNKMSHPSRLSLSSTISLSDKGVLYLGGAYDTGKHIAYTKEVQSKVSLAEIFPNLIQGVERNFSGEMKSNS